MDISLRSRPELEGFFKRNAIPTEGNFKELIAASLNQKDDGIHKPAGGPLSIEGSGDAASQKRAINFYEDFADADPAWSISLNPRTDPADPTTAKPGFGITDGEGNLRLSVDRKTVGLRPSGPDEWELLSLYSYGRSEASWIGIDDGYIYLAGNGRIFEVDNEMWIYGAVIAEGLLYAQSGIDIEGGGIAVHQGGISVAKGIELGEGVATLCPQGVRRIQNPRDPLLLVEGWEKDFDLRKSTLR